MASCPNQEKVDELYLTIYGNGKLGLERDMDSMKEWRTREEDRSKGNRRLLWGILLVLLPIAASRILDYTPLRQKQDTTTTTIDQEKNTHSTTTTGAHK